MRSDIYPISRVISLSRLNSNNYRWRAGNRIRKVTHGSMVILQGKKYEIYYLLVGSSVRGGVSGVGGLGTRRVTWKDDRQRCKVKFQLP